MRKTYFLFIDNEFVSQVQAEEEKEIQVEITENKHINVGYVDDKEKITRKRKLSISIEIKNGKVEVLKIFEVIEDSESIQGTNTIFKMFLDLKNPRKSQAETQIVNSIHGSDTIHYSHMDILENEMDKGIIKEINKRIKIKNEK